MIRRIFQRYNRWASSRMHMHFYAWEPVCDWLDVDMIPVPAPASLDRFLLRYCGGSFWRFSFDS